MKKAELKTFLSKTDRMLLNAGFRRTIVSDHSSYEWIKETRYGMVECDPDNDFPSKIYSIFCRFKDTYRAKAILYILEGDCYHNGKCNFHTKTQEEIIYQFTRFLKLIA